MGCITSKGMGRSMSIHEQFNQGFHALAIGEEDFHMTRRERDRIITLIKIASGKNLRGFRYVESETDESISRTKPFKSVEEQDGKGRESQGSDSSELPESSNLGQDAASETDTINHGSATCRSFHTLEEFEELIQKVKLFEARIVENAYSGVESEPVADPTRDSLETCHLSEDRGITTLKNPMAREVESISATAELSSVGSLKEWIHAGDDIYSAGSYMTPRFGSYAIDRSEFGTFNPELVAAFEECMQQMEAEEVAIVKQMEQSFT